VPSSAQRKVRLVAATGGRPLCAFSCRPDARIRGPAVRAGVLPGGRRHVADFVKNACLYRPASNFPCLVPDAPENALLVSEQLAFPAGFRNRRAIDFDEGAGSALRVLVNGAGDQVFPTPLSPPSRPWSFVAPRARPAPAPPAFGRSAHDVVVGVAASQRLAQRTVLFSQRCESNSLESPARARRGRTAWSRNRSRRFHRVDGAFDRAVGRHYDHGSAAFTRFTAVEIPVRSFPEGASRSPQGPVFATRVAGRLPHRRECTTKPSSPSCSSSSRLILASSSTTRIAAFWRVFTEFRCRGHGRPSLSSPRQRSEAANRISSILSLRTAMDTRFKLCEDTGQVVS